jgi:hypothetical protein
MTRWQWRPADFVKGLPRGGGETVLGGSRHRGKRFGVAGRTGSSLGDRYKMTRLGREARRRRCDTGLERLVPGSIRATLGSSKRWQPGQRSLETCFSSAGAHAVGQTGDV